ncbi:hypothetical protein DEJ45_04370 [Streptomyces venezuelae]|uniref:DUF4232 domain-containing protein n=1 Tax=Streptomyces venezuelae TaxID=54571 RepID=UPI00123DC4D9|nr:DUF4232 domain-containing protein [Streptomyces venezuelae]QES11721.1 hypothetical protein DEJ45_04370 [Streptomyces venezuelae]
MSGRLTRTRLLAATTVAVAALSLTACGGGDVKDEGAAVSSSSPAAPTASASRSAGAPAATPTDGSATKPGEEAAGTSGGGSKNGGSTTGGSTGSGSTTGGKTGSSTSGGGKGTGSNGSTTGGNDDGNGPSRTPCGAKNTKTTATPLSRPLNHMLLTVTNTGSGLCELLNYPVARFGEAQSVPPVIEATKPQAVVTLAPGESGYAAVILSAADGSGTGGYTTSSLTIGFADESTSTPRLGGKGVYVDSSLRVTYWQTSMDDALN